MAFTEVAPHIGVQRSGGESHAAGIVQVFGLCKHANNDLEQLGPRGICPLCNCRVVVGAFGQEVWPVLRRQSRFEPSLSQGVDSAYEVAKQRAVLDGGSEQQLNLHFALALGDQLPALRIQRRQALADQRGLAPCRGGGLLLQNVVDLDGMSPRGLVWLREQQRSDALAFERHERSSGDFCVVDGHKESVIEKALL